MSDAWLIKLRNRQSSILLCIQYTDAKADTERTNNQALRLRYMHTKRVNSLCK